MGDFSKGGSTQNRWILMGFEMFFIASKNLAPGAFISAITVSYVLWEKMEKKGSTWSLLDCLELASGRAEYRGAADPADFGVDKTVRSVHTPDIWDQKNVYIKAHNFSSSNLQRYVRVIKISKT